MTDGGGARAARAWRGGGARAAGATRGGETRGGRWRAWRRSRPFWGGLLVALGGAEILLTLRAPLPVILHIGPQGLAGYLGPVILLLCGVLLVAHPPQRVFYALVSLVLALVSWLTSNLGGFFVGMLLALVGGCLAFAWTPARTPRPGTAPATRPAATTAVDPMDPEDDPETSAGPEASAGPETSAGPEPVPVTDGRHRWGVDQT
ncbi:DUF6114 domain-containing protein [Micromonospora rubida]|uniref:DUF6114 domain-containing protein n=1 Tax=Micromonospora rubida TaxID=2697657 RepID=UPI001F1735B0|nr:DUF6114 domain-containing protein [Micromonospora rubida]